MTTDTSKAPERIWAIPERNCTVYMSGNSPIMAQDGPFTHHRHGTATEYVRRDIFDAMQAENERLRDALSNSNDTFSGIAEHILERKPDRNKINWKGIFADCQRGGIAARAALERNGDGT